MFFSRRSPFEVSLWKAATYAISTRLSFLTIRESLVEVCCVLISPNAFLVRDGSRSRYSPGVGLRLRYRFEVSVSLKALSQRPKNTPGTTEPHGCPE